MSNQKDFSTEIYEAAIALGKKGYKVLRVAKEGKAPCEKNGCYGATNDLSEIENRFGTHDGNIGIAADERTVFLDLDGKEGVESVDNLQKELGGLPDTYAEKTPRCGLHLFFRLPEGVRLTNTCNVFKSVDIRAFGTMIVAAPSVGKNNDGEICCYASWKGDEIPNVADLPLLPQAWIDYIKQSNKTQINKTQRIESPVINAPSNEYSAEEKIRRCRGFMKKREVAVQGQRGQNTMFSAICAIFDGYDLSKTDGWDILMEYNSRCLPPWDMSNPQDTKWINYSVDKAINNPTDRGALLRQERTSKNCYDNFCAKALKNFDVDLARFEESAESDETAKKIDEDVLTSVSIKDGRKDFIDKNAFNKYIKDNFESNESSIIGAFVRSVGENKAVGFCRGLQMCQGLASMWDICAVVKKRGINQDPMAVPSNLFLTLLTGSGGYKTTSQALLEDCFRYLGLDALTRGEVKTDVTVKLSFAQYRRRILNFDEFERKLQSMRKDRNGCFARVMDVLLDVYEASTNNSYVFSSSGSEMRQKDWKETAIYRPFASASFSAPIDNYVNWFSTPEGRESCTNGFMARQIFVLGEDDEEIDDSIFADDHTDARRKYLENKNSCGVPKRLTDVLKPWKDKIEEEGVYQDSTSAEMNENEKLNAFDKGLCLAMTKAYSTAYSMIEKFCCKTTKRMRKAGNALGEADFRRVATQAVRLSILFALDRCNPNNIRRLYLKKRDIKLAFEYVVNFSEEAKQNMFCFVKDAGRYRIDELLCNALEECVKGKKTNKISWNAVQREVARVNNKTKVRLEVAKRSDYLKDLKDFGNIYFDEKDVDRDCVEFLRPWEPIGNYANYKTSELDAIFAYLNEDEEEEIPEDLRNGDYEIDVRPLDDLALDHLNAENYEALSRKENEEIQRLKRENDLLKSRNNELEIEQHNQRKRKQAPVETPNLINSVAKNKTEESIDKYFEEIGAKRATDPQPIIETEDVVEIESALNSEPCAKPVCAGSSDCQIELSPTKVEYTESNDKYYKTKRRIIFTDGTEVELRLSNPMSSDRFLLVDKRKINVSYGCHQLLMRCFDDDCLTMDKWVFANFVDEYICDSDSNGVIESFNKELKQAGLRLSYGEFVELDGVERELDDIELIVD